jgi:hypothetical protein
MSYWFRWLLVLGTALFAVQQFLLSASAQNGTADPSAPPVSNLRMLTRNSGYIFDGTVLSVERIAEAEPGSVAAVQITFRVEQAIRGVRNGQVLSIREWAGLWNSGERYRAGERLLLFLYSPSKLGLTSPVGGPQGRFAVDPGGNILSGNARLAPFSAYQTPRQPSTDPTSRASRLSSRTLALALQRMARE